MKIITFTTALAVVSFVSTTMSPLMGVIPGVSCLENTESKHKVILIHDRHDVQGEFPERIAHQKELGQLIQALVKRTAQSSFFIEYPHRTTNFKTTYDHSTVHVPIKHAQRHGMQQAGLVYKPFDERVESYFWVREMLENTQAVDDALKNGMQLPSEFKAVSVGAYVSALQADEKKVRELAQQMSTQLQEKVAEKVAAYQEVYNLIQTYSAHFKVQPEDHIWNIIKNVRSPQLKNTLHIAVTQANAAYTDVALWNSVMHDANAVSVVHGGANHTCQLEKALVLNAYVNAYPDMNLAKGLSAHDLWAITFPAQNPPSFIKPLYSFLSLCNACGTQTSTRCSACKKIYYCGSSCQKDDWKEHKTQCKKQ